MLDLDETAARHALFSRARKALGDLLRAASPPVSDKNTEIEFRALNLAIARTEAEIAVRRAIRGSIQRLPVPILPPEAPTATPAQIQETRVEELAQPELPVPDPATEPGPALEVGKQGLTLAALSLPASSFDPTVQSALLQRLKRLCPDLQEATRRVGNTHPSLMAVISEYSDLVAMPLEALDVTALWAVGTGLLANREAFTRLPQSGGMTEPLEPAHLALLQQVSEIHGALILGFERGRALTDRADHSRLTPEILATIMPSAQGLLEKWRHSIALVEARTRKFIAAIEGGAVGPSWEAARVGYSIYVVTRNALIGVGMMLLKLNGALATVIGSAAMTQIQPELGQQALLWVQFILENARTIMSFSEPFPELKIWFASLIATLERDRNSVAALKQD